jgi:hypothetical protein
MAARMALPGQVRDAKNAVNGPSINAVLPTPLMDKPDFPMHQKDNGGAFKSLINNNF